jgi:hypothetical protein
MDVNLNKGEVNIISDDYINGTSSEITIQITDTLAIKYTLDKINKKVKVSLMNTLIDDPEFSGEVDMDNFLKIYKGTKQMYNQLSLLG